ncbi:hypothetical protein HMPREF0322_04089 [Desulfitobacterium hafniense DP7]|uniref:Uncharacterized protein n=1 Tax=Desulfitobacterium hafniense DP7 TaxID=537010 RepID=G9XSY3_DESHA|nr:hypothetical protein HMPREF0322_04089 [Desulfitobacterium hafniense DP7]
MILKEVVFKPCCIPSSVAFVLAAVRALTGLCQTIILLSIDIK